MFVIDNINMAYDLIYFVSSGIFTTVVMALYISLSAIALNKRPPIVICYSENNVKK